MRKVKWGTTLIGPQVRLRDRSYYVVYRTCMAQRLNAVMRMWKAELGTRVRHESLFLRLVTYLWLALKDLRPDLRLEHKDLRLTWDSTLNTRDLLATCKSLCYSQVVIKDELGNQRDFFCIMSPRYSSLYGVWWGSVGPYSTVTLWILNWHDKL